MKGPRPSDGPHPSQGLRYFDLAIATMRRYFDTFAELTDPLAMQGYALGAVVAAGEALHEAIEKAGIAHADRPQMEDAALAGLRGAMRGTGPVDQHGHAWINPLADELPAGDAPHPPGTKPTTH